ncbi:MAG: T9SS type A sorting domain-containing protein [Bacteroidetes bacterium]|nr:MAG: T9SS type A sorting domain-containing protein [Bacteroidota bacterium]
MEKLSIKNAVKLIAAASAFFLLTAQTIFGQSNNVRGMYVKNIDNWLGDVAEENAILTYAQGNAYTYITFYDLGSLNFNSSTTKNALASFINRAKTQYGITEMGAAGETASFFSSNIIPYNNGRSLATEKFDVLNFEFEFWVSSSISGQYCSKYLSPNGFSCDTSGAYKFAKREMQTIKSLSTSNGLIFEMYLGWPNRGQMQEVANSVDRLLLHAYRPDDSDVYQYSKNRLIDVASIGRSVKVIPIFSAEPAFMGAWLNTHALTKPYQTYSSFYAAETGTWKQNINLQGYHWFTYSEMPKTVTAQATISANGPTTFCTGGSVTLSANSGAAYLWAPGGQTTNSIIVSQSGSYTVTVINTAGVSITSSPVNVSVGNTTTSPTISASGPTTFCSSSSVTLTSSAANTYLWSNGATTQSITVNQSGNYTVAITSGSCSATSSPTVVTATAAPNVPTVTSSGPLTSCIGNSITLTSSTANGYLWSTGATSSSIAVSTSGTYWVRTFSAGNCYSQSSNVVVTAASPPATPVVNATGSTSLCPGETVLLSTAYSSGGYLWSTGATTQTLTVSSAGTYWVKVFNGNNCSAQSANTIITMNSSSVPVISASGSTSLCSGTSVTLTSSNSGNYTWSNGATTQSITVSTAGTYWVRTGTGNCVNQSSNIIVTTNGPATPVVTASSSLTICDGSTVTLTSSLAGGYLWSTGATSRSIDVSTSGTYWVRAYVSGSCFAQSTNQIVSVSSSPAIPVITASGSLTLSSSNPTVVLTSSPANSYLWTNGQTTQSITVNTAGNYFVTVSGSAGCTSSSAPTTVTTVACTPPAVPYISVSGSTVLQPGQTVSLSSSAATGYLWSTGETTKTITVSTAGTYTVRVYNSANCFSISLPVTITELTTSINTVESQTNINSFSVYPNPGRDRITFSYLAASNEDATLLIFDISGREMERREILSYVGENKIEMNVSDYPRGVYFGYLITKNDKQIIRLILN